MIKICMVFNHLDHSDGVSKAAIGIANLLVKRIDCQVFLIPIFRYDFSIRDLLSTNVYVKPIFRGYFKGLNSILSFLPGKLLYKLVIKDKYDYEIAFQEHLATKVIASSTNKEAVKYAWMHVYFGNIDFKIYNNKLSKLICVSQENALRVKNEHPELSVKVDYCYNPIDDKNIIEMGRQNCEITKEKEKVTFVSVGRLHPQKGYLRLLSCCHHLKEEGYEFSLWLIGDGPERGKLQEYIDSENLGDIVKLMGSQVNPHMYTSKADVFVCSSVYEGYSTACTEAIILGVPVITTAVSGAKEIIETAESGMLVGNSDNELLDGMRYVLNNRNIVDIWKKQLKVTASRFSYDERAKRLVYKILEINK